MKNERGVDEIIQKAIEAGDFENLPGAGKPIAWDPNDFSGDDWELAHHLLKENGFAPDFIEIRKAIEADLTKCKADYERARRWRTTAIAKGEQGDWIEKHWAQAQEKYRHEIDALNKRIRDYNLIIPADSYYRAALSPELD